MTRRAMLLAAMLLAMPLAARVARAQQQSASAASAGATVNPHGKLKDECATCHRADSWKPARVSKSFVHAPGRFPLEGAHASASCRSCHVSLDFKGVSSKCATCHEDIHRGELGAECARCHTARSFLDRTVMQRVHQTTRFPLTGAHVTVDCSSCHTPAAQGQLRFVNRSTECVSCHLTVYNATTNPPHLSAGFPQQCEVCHTTVAWNRARFDHNATTFPLTGAHRAVLCANCHGDGVYRGKSTACASCHTKDYNATTDPPHASTGFPMTCEGCHNTTTWVGATFDHNTTRFPLTGAHKPLACNSCHGDGVFAGKSTQCVSCHLDKYNATTDPKHSNAGFSTDCTTCHTTTAWSGATFNHSTTQFPLTGAHVPLDCNACHGDGVYRGKSTACVSCHLTDYNGTNNPPHATAGFPSTCATCHTTTAWAGATFNHTYFPTNHGNANGTCSTCHTNSANYAVFTCTTCHAQGTTDSHHRQVSGYRYDSNACYSCHPRGRN
jgi:hypothetical protein